MKDCQKGELTKEEEKNERMYILATTMVLALLLREKKKARYKINPTLGSSLIGFIPLSEHFSFTLT